jgi:hypothetical protein
MEKWKRGTSSNLLPHFAFAFAFAFFFSFLVSGKSLTPLRCSAIAPSETYDWLFGKELNTSAVLCDCSFKKPTTR